MQNAECKMQNSGVASPRIIGGTSKPVPYDGSIKFYKVGATIGRPFFNE